MSALNPRPILSAVVWLGLWAGGCADAGIDREDELGTATDGRYELVVLEPVEGQSDSTADLSPAPANIAVFFDPDGSFTVQVGVYRDVDRAEQLVRDLKDQGYPAYGARSPKGMRVRIGYFSKREDAERFGRIFAADRGVEYWVDKRADK
ncbi:MAG: SPOR domain-containing protein [Candidatus Latescibacterota bacterium]|nr:SPOR domain-containing protein [Candidatus Latescibacterota bacterium]